MWREREKETKKRRKNREMKQLLVNWNRNNGSSKQRNKTQKNGPEN